MQSTIRRVVTQDTQQGGFSQYNANVTYPLRGDTALLARILTGFISAGAHKTGRCAPPPDPTVGGGLIYLPHSRSRVANFIAIIFNQSGPLIKLALLNGFNNPPPPTAFCALRKRLRHFLIIGDEIQIFLNISVMMKLELRSHQQYIKTTFWIVKFFLNFN